MQKYSIRFSFKVYLHLDMILSSTFYFYFVQQNFDFQRLPAVFTFDRILNVMSWPILNYRIILTQPVVCKLLLACITFCEMFNQLLPQMERHVWSTWHWKQMADYQIISRDVIIMSDSARDGGWGKEASCHQLHPLPKHNITKGCIRKYLIRVEIKQERWRDLA